MKFLPFDFISAVTAISLGRETTIVHAAPGDCFPLKTNLSSALNSFVKEGCATDSTCPTVVTWGLIEDWCTSYITDMSSLFDGKTTFNEDISQWDTSHVTSMARMFYNAQAFNQDISVWNTTSVNKMNFMLAIALAFNQDISQWNTESVTDMSYMFFFNSEFNRNISMWNTRKVTSMSNMFDSASAFNGDISGWNTTRVTNLANMFANAKSFNGDISGWDTSKVIAMKSMFYNAGTFNRDISGWNTVHVTNMQTMFYFASSFSQDISVWNTAKVNNMGGMFVNTHFNGDISKWNTSSVKNMESLFSGAVFFNQDISGWDTASVTSMAFMFTSATAFNQDISGWTTECVTSMEYMFSSANAFNQDLSGWNTTRVTRMANMFNSAQAFNQNLCSWKQHFPYNSATNIFTGSGCIYKDTPTNSSSSFCAVGNCTVKETNPTSISPPKNPTDSPTKNLMKTPTYLFDQIVGKSITSNCYIDGLSSMILMCSASTDANVADGIFKTNLLLGNCSSEEQATGEGPDKSLGLASDLTCKNEGTCIFKHCFRADYIVDGIGVLADMTEINSTVTYKKDGSFQVDVQTAEFVPNSSTLSSSVAKTVSASLGECGITPRISTLQIGDIAVICVFIGDDSITLHLASVVANNGSQLLVNSDGVPNFVSEVLNEGTNQVTLKTLMLPEYYNAQNGNLGSVTISGTGLITYTTRHLDGKRVLTHSEESQFALAVPLSHIEKTKVSQKIGKKNNNAGSHFYLNFSVLTTVGAIFVLY